MAGALAGANYIFQPRLPINSGLNDAWYSAAKAGQGFFTVAYPESEIMFLAWFTYDTERPGENVLAQLGEVGYRWLTAQGPYEGDTASLDVYLTRGGVLDSAAPQPETSGPIGTISIVWHDCENGTLSYDLERPKVAGQIEITRIVQDNVALCEALSR